MLISKSDLFDILKENVEALEVWSAARDVGKNEFDRLSAV